MSTHLDNDNLIRTNGLRATTGHPDGTVLGEGPPSSTPAHQRRILAKLETLWAAQPHRPLIDLLDGSIIEHSPRDAGIWAGTDDETIEVSLDGALKEAGLTVSGGWRS